MRGTSSRGVEDMPTMDFLKWNGVRFSEHRVAAIVASAASFPDANRVLQ